MLDHALSGGHEIDLVTGLAERLPMVTGVARVAGCVCTPFIVTDASIKEDGSLEARSVKVSPLVVIQLGQYADVPLVGRHHLSTVLSNMQALSALVVFHAREVAHVDAPAAMVHGFGEAVMVPVGAAATTVAGAAEAVAIGL